MPVPGVPGSALSGAAGPLSLGARRASGGSPPRPWAASGRAGPRRSARSSPVGASVCAQVLLDPRHREHDAPVGQLLAQRPRGRRAAVMSISTIASALSTNHCTGIGGAVDRGQRAPAEVLGVGEEQRRVVAVDHQPGHQRRVRVVVDVVHAGQVRARSPRSRRAAGPPGAAGRAPRARSRPARPGARRRPAPRRWWPARCSELAAPEAGEPAELRRRRSAAARRTRRRRRARRSGRTRAAGRRRAGRARTVATAVTRPVSWVRPPDGVADRRAAAAAADREAVHQARAEVGGAERQQLALGVDALAAAVGERAPGQDVVGVADEGDARAPAAAARRRRRADTSGSAGDGQAGRDRRRSTVTPVLAQVQHGDGGGRADHADQGIGARGASEAADQHRRQGDQAEQPAVGACTWSRWRANETSSGQEAVAVDRRSR